MLSSNSCAYAALPKNSRCAGAGIANRKTGARPKPARAGVRGRRAKASPASKVATTLRTRAASSAMSAKIDTVSSERQAGTTPRMLKLPEVGL